MLLAPHLNSFFFSFSFEENCLVIEAYFVGNVLQVKASTKANSITNAKLSGGKGPPQVRNNVMKELIDSLESAHPLILFNLYSYRLKLQLRDKHMTS